MVAAHDTTPAPHRGALQRRLRRRRAILPFFPATPSDVIALLPQRLTAEQVLELLGRRPARLRRDLTGSSNQRGGSGGAFGVFVEVDNLFLKSRLPQPGERNDHTSLIAGEQARRSTGIYHPDRLWFLVEHPQNGICACSLTPILPILREQLQATSGSEQRPWARYLDALELAFSLATHQGVLLDCNPNNFGIDGASLYYVDDDLVRGPQSAAFVLQALLRLREYPQAPTDLRAWFLDQVLQLAARCGRERLLSWGTDRDVDEPLLWPQEQTLRSRLEGFRHWLGT